MVEIRLKIKGCKTRFFATECVIFISFILRYFIFELLNKILFKFSIKNN